MQGITIEYENEKGEVIENLPVNFGDKSVRYPLFKDNKLNTWEELTVQT